MRAIVGCVLMLVLSQASAEAQATRERFAIPQTFKGRAITVTGELSLPPGTARCPP